MISSFPREPGFGGKTDYVFFFVGALTTEQNHLIPRIVKADAMTVNKLQVYLESAPTGDDAEFEFYVDDVSIGAVTVLDGETSGSLDLDPVEEIAANSVVTMEINQVGSEYQGRTATGIVRIA